MDGGEWSRRANEALIEGKRPAAMIAKDLGVPIEAVEQYGTPTEWHHVGKSFEEVDFYDVDDFEAISAEDISDEADAERFKRLVLIRGFVVLPEPKVTGKFTVESRDEKYDLFVRPGTRVTGAQDAAFDEALSKFSKGELDLGGLQEAAAKFEQTYLSEKLKIESAVKAFVKKHKDWAAKKRRARSGANGLRYLESNGVVYGYYDPNTNELHLNEDYADLDTPIHEWTHIWWVWLEKQDPRMVKRQSCRFVLTF